MDLTKQYTYLNEGATKRVIALGKNALLVRNACVEDKQPDKLIKESETQREQNYQPKKIEEQLVDLKSSVS